jgi:ribosome maturation protein Sdo1
MAEQIDVESALEDAIFELTEVEDMRDQGDMRRKVADVIEECLRPALAAVANEKRIQAALDSLGVLLAINEQATDEAKRDPGVMPVLRALDCKVAKLSAPEFQQASSTRL